MLNKQLEQEFEALATPLIAWLKANHHLHTMIIIDHSGAKFLENHFDVIAGEGN